MNIKVFIVLSDDCVEKECDCEVDSIDSVWLDEEDAKKQAATLFRGYVLKFITEDALPPSFFKKK